jgi:membrane protease YdiL (CAAX protease family)
VPRAVFLLVAFGLSWLVTLPLWISGGPLGGLSLVVTGMVMMTTPSLAVLVWWWWEKRHATPDRPAPTWRQLRRSTGISTGFGTRRTVGVSALAWFGTPPLAVLAIALSAAVGVVQLDLEHLSLLNKSMASSPGGSAGPVDARALATIQIGIALFFSPIANSLFAFGEEWGWRGWLLPRLVRERGLWPGLVLTGVTWGLWHAPLTLRGYNYPNLGPFAAVMFIGFCVIFGVLIGWLRLWTGSVWPAVVAHAALNGCAGITLLIGDAAAPPNLALAGITGVVGWVLLALLCAALARLRPLDLRRVVSPDAEVAANAPVGADAAPGATSAQVPPPDARLT